MKLFVDRFIVTTFKQYEDINLFSYKYIFIVQSIETWPSEASILSNSILWRNNYVLKHKSN